MRSEDVGDFVKQRTACLVLQPGLRSRFREGLARKSGAEDLVLRYRFFAVTDVTVNRADAWIVQPIEFTEFGVGFAGKDTLVTQTAQSLVKSTQSREEVDESQGVVLRWRESRGQKGGDFKLLRDARGAVAGRRLADAGATAAGRSSPWSWEDAGCTRGILEAEGCGCLGCCRVEEGGSVSGSSRRMGY